MRGTLGIIPLLVIGSLCLPTHAAAISSRTLIAPTGEASSNYFGSSVALAGDVNGDGFPDVIVGAPFNNGFIGRAYIYYGGPGADAAPDVVLTGVAAGNVQFGASVAGVGDVNGDGYADVIVGAPYEGGIDGRAYVFFGGPTLVSEGAGSADVILTGEVLAGAGLGASVAGAGDLNRDGYPDLIVGASYYSTYQGRAYVFYGGPTLVSKNASSANVILTGQGGFDYFGTSARGIGDVNGDAYPDIVAGAPGYSFGNGTGRAYVFYGGSTLVSKNAASADVILTGEALSTSFGTSVSGGEDVSGDGRPDLIVGATGIFSSTGRAYVFFGGPSLFSKNASNADVLLTGESNGNSFGASVARAGDINGDGVADLVVGAPGYGTGNGRGYVFLGGGYLYTKSAGSAELILTGVSGENFGGAVSGIGDFDGDAHLDVAAGAALNNASTGRAYRTLSYPYQVVSPNGGEQWVSGKPATVRWRGHDLADIAYSSDGGVTYATLAVGVGGLETNQLTITSPGPTTLAKARVSYTSQFLSRASSDASDGVFRIVEPVVPHSAAERLQLTLTGTAAGDEYAHSARGAGDVNGDGYADLIVGEIYNDVGGADAGRAYVYFGGPGADSVADLTFTGEAAGDNLGWSVAGAGDVNGDGYADLIAGSPWHSGAVAVRTFSTEGPPRTPSRISF